MRPPRLRRSLLFVPGGEQRKLERARDSVADTLLFDLEDAVPPEGKDAARRLVADTIVAGGFGERELAVRVNAPGTPYFDADLEAVVSAGAAAVLVPKCESSPTVARIAAALEVLERGREGIRTSLLCLVESPAGVIDAVTIGRAAERVEALGFGHADFSLEMGLSAADASRGVVYHARCALVIAAKAARVAAIDCVHLAVRDAAAFREDARLGLELGYEGKLCIHPQQAEIVNQVYTPDGEQIEYARRVIEAAEEAQATGRGVFALDGKMIDAPLVAVQQRVLERARRAGAL